MKNAVFVLILFSVFQSCVSVRKKDSYVNVSKTIAYILPDTVEELINTEIVKTNQKVYFELWNEDSCYRIYLNHIDEKLNNTWVIKSSRKVFVKGNLFPIVFDYDRAFAITEDVKSFLKKYSKEKNFLVKRQLLIRESAYFIRFNKITHKIIEQGY